MTATPNPLLRVTGLVKDFPLRGEGWARATIFRAVDDVSLEIHPAENVALVGESGSGKTTVGRMIAGLMEPTKGEILFEGRDRSRLSAADQRALTRSLQMIFQDPAGSLDPRWRVGDSIAEPLVAHGWGTAEAIRTRVQDLLVRVGLDPAFARRFPHQMSGGQKQRVGIARAIALEPRLIIADEPTSALDVSIRLQILDLLAELGRDLGTSFLFISHDLAIVRRYCQRVYVMAEGRIVEQGPTEEVLTRPLETYTQRLLASVPGDHPHRRRIIATKS